MASSQLPRGARLVAGGFVSLLLGALSIQCSAGGTSGGTGSGTFTNGAGSGGAGSGSHTGSGGAGNNPSSGSQGMGGITIDAPQGMDYSADQIFLNDPPPMNCDGGGMAPPTPGGTPMCPDDKNLPGCGCATPGQTAACWTGYRKDRGHGDCKDGMTVCKRINENDLQWGPCVGETLPVMGATGKAACGCFSAGHWEIANLSPCFELASLNPITPMGVAVSTYVDGSGKAQCPMDFMSVPAQAWSTDTLTVDCTGHFKLCYSLKAGDGKHPMPSDCTITQACTEKYYGPANMKEAFPDLAGWLADGTNNPTLAACVNQFVNSGGYGEMSVTGQTDDCENIQKVFQHVTYCPLACNQDPNAPGCAGCMMGGGGQF